MDIVCHYVIRQHKYVDLFICCPIHLKVFARDGMRIQVEKRLEQYTGELTAIEGHQHSSHCEIQAKATFGV